MTTLKRRAHPDTMLLLRLLSDTDLDDAERERCEAALERLVARAVAGEKLDPYARRVLIGIGGSRTYRLTVRRRKGRPAGGEAGNFAVAQFLRRQIFAGKPPKAIITAAVREFGLGIRRIRQIAQKANLEI